MSRRLRTTLLSLFIAVLCTGLFSGLANAQSTQNFTINSFSADYYLTREADKSSTLVVNEVISAQFPAFDQNHGILRSIPKRYKEHTLSLDVNSVKDKKGNDYQYSTSSENDNEVLKIGDPNTYVQGETTYEINYKLRNVISFEDNQDEFYWDINGDQWPQTFGQVDARVHIPSDLAKSLKPEQLCFAGYYGKNQFQCTISTTSNNLETIVETKVSNLPAYSTLTIALAFNQGTFANGPEVAREELIAKILAFAWVFFVFGVPIITVAFLIYKWRKFGRDPKGRGTIIPEYQPPKDMDVIASDYLQQESMRSLAISAQIVGLATRRYINIYEVPKKGMFGSKDYELELVKDTSDLTPAELKIVNMMSLGSMPGGVRVKISSLKYKLAAELKALDTQTSDELEKLGYFANNPLKITKKYRGWGIGLLIIGFFTTGLMGVGIGLLVSGLIAMLFASKMPAKTAQGVLARDYLKGLAMYIKLAEADRIKYLQSPEGAEKYANDKNFDPKSPAMKIKLFEQLLPYAMIFGLEKDWAKQFEGLYKQGPDWYQGDYTTFRTAYLASALSDFNSVSAPSFSSPSSSGSSGFGGGGFSGGGGGGGGGGGW